jgi:molybdopterin synthase catalytic subunit
MSVRIVTDAIDKDEVVRSITSDQTGAVVTFSGIVRQLESGNLEALEYQHYEEMALSEMEKIRSGALHKFDILDMAIFHRIGILRIGEDSVFIAVSSRHRKDAFRACEFAIDRIKETVPIWKKDILAGGTHQWHD